MRFFHLSDLHIGKLLNSYNLQDMQIDVLDKTIELIKEYRPNAIIIAGDVYDKSVPSAEAYEIFDDYLTKLSKIEPSIPVLIIAGNHDNVSQFSGYMPYKMQPCCLKFISKYTFPNICTCTQINTMLKLDDIWKLLQD